VDKLSADDNFELRLAVVLTQLAEPGPLHDFYKNILKLPIAKKVGDHWIEYGNAPGSIGTNIAIHAAEEMSPADPPETILSFEVKKIESLRSHLQNAGVKCSDIYDRERGRFFLCEDPARNTLHFIEFNAEWRAKHAY
jgi:hypothetical protein